MVTVNELSDISCYGVKHYSVSLLATNNGITFISRCPTLDCSSDKEWMNDLLSQIRHNSSWHYDVYYMAMKQYNARMINIVNTVSLWFAIEFDSQVNKWNGKHERTECKRTKCVFSLFKLVAWGNLADIKHYI